jgi:hypothetical protein
MKIMIRLWIPIVIVLILLAGLVIADRVSAAPEAGSSDAPQAAVTSYARYTLLSASGVTSTQTSTGIRIAGFEYIDCFGAIDVTLPQTVTISYQASADGVNYATVTSHAAQSADITVFTRTLVYGEYYRTVAALAGANPATVSVKCVAKN